MPACAEVDRVTRQQWCGQREPGDDVVHAQIRRDLVSGLAAAESRSRRTGQPHDAQGVELQPTGDGDDFIMLGVRRKEILRQAERDHAKRIRRAIPVPQQTLGLKGSEKTVTHAPATSSQRVQQSSYRFAFLAPFQS